MKTHVFQACRKNTILQVLVLGTLTWLFYLDLTLTYPLPPLVSRFPLTDLGRVNNWSPLSLYDFLSFVFGTLFLYLLTWRLVRHRPLHRRLVWLVLAFSAAFSLTLLVIYPIAATDIFEYVFHSRILVHYGENPLVTAPIAFKGDPFLKTVNWAVQPSPYGPLWVVLTVPGTLLAGNDLVLNLMLMKALATIFHVACTVVIGAILHHVDRPNKVAGMVLFGWNPLVLFEASGNGHNGIIMMFFALLGIYFLVRRRWLWILPALAASVLVKYVTAILAVPFLIYSIMSQLGNRARLAFLVKTCLLTGLLAIILTIPFMAIPTGLLYEASFSSLLAIPTLAFNWLKSGVGDQSAKNLTVVASSSTYLIVYLSSLKFLMPRQRPNQLFVLMTWLTLAYLFIGSMHFQPWFVIWPISLGIWVNHSLTRKVLVTFTLSALLSYAANYVWIWNIRSMQHMQVNLMFVAVIFAPPALVVMAHLALKAVACLKSPVLELNHEQG